VTQRIARFFRGDKAATSIEYAMILAVILMTILSAITILGGRTGKMWNNISASVKNISPPASSSPQ
jgi:pilus assembly protein Flp/PilA